MQKFFAYALCAGMACFLAVVYTLLRIDWEKPPPAPKDVPAAVAPAEKPPAPGVEKK